MAILFWGRDKRFELFRGIEVTLSFPINSIYDVPTDTLLITANTSNIVSFAYYILPLASSAPTALDVFSNGTLPTLINNTATVLDVGNGLSAGDYVVYVAAVSNGVYSSVVPQPFSVISSATPLTYTIGTELSVTPADIDVPLPTNAVGDRVIIVGRANVTQWDSLTIPAGWTITGDGVFFVATGISTGAMADVRIGNNVAGNTRVLPIVVHDNPSVYNVSSFLTANTGTDNPFGATQIPSVSVASGGLSFSVVGSFGILPSVVGTPSVTNDQSYFVVTAVNDEAGPTSSARTYDWTGTTRSTFQVSIGVS